MASIQITLNPSSNTTGTGTLSNASSAYTSTTSTTYATLSGSSTGTPYTTYLGFDFSNIPTDAIIESIACSVKARVNNTSRFSAATASLYLGTSSISDSISFRNTGETVYQLSNIRSIDRENLDNIQLFFSITKSSRYSTANAYIYGADLTITYSIPTVSVNATITNGVITSPSSFPVDIAVGSSLTIEFGGNSGYEFASMTVNGTAVTPEIYNGSIDLSTVTATTNFGTYSGSMSNILDSDDNTYFWSNEAQTVGKYILFTFANPVTLGGASFYSSNSTDYPGPNFEFQVSTDNSTWTTVGTMTDGARTEFTDLRYSNIKYARIYAVSGKSNWLVLNSASFRCPSSSYTIESVTGDTEIVIRYREIRPYWSMIKTSTGWKGIMGIYKKTSLGWEEITEDELKNIATTHQLIRR